MKWTRIFAILILLIIVGCTVSLITVKNSGDVDIEQRSRAESSADSLNFDVGKKKTKKNQ